MDSVRVLLLLLPLLGSLSAAEVQDNEVFGRTKASLETVSAEQPQPCPADLHALLREMSVKLAENRLMIQEQAAKLAKYEVKIEQLETLNQEQDCLLREIQTKANEVDLLKEQLREQAGKLKDFEMQVDLQQQAQTAELMSLKIRTNVTETHVDSLRRDQAVGRVAFSASLLTSGSLGAYTGPFNTDTTLLFKHVLTNIGKAYNAHTGIFSAPARGVYHFDYYILGGPQTRAGLVKNGEHVIAAEEGQSNGWGTTGNGATLLLEAGDVVFLRLWAGYKIYDNEYHHCTFSGRLLFPM